MRVNYDHATGNHIVTLNETEAQRLIGFLNVGTRSIADPEADSSSQLEDALTELLT